MPEVKVTQLICEGDKVTVTYTGTVERVYAHGNRVWVRTPHDAHAVYLNSGAYKVELAEPDYVVGALYKDADGDLFIRIPGGWYDPAGEIVNSETFPTRPLQKVEAPDHA